MQLNLFVAGLYSVNRGLPCVDLIKKIKNLICFCSFAVCAYNSSASVWRNLKFGQRILSSVATNLENLNVENSGNLKNCQNLREI